MVSKLEARVLEISYKNKTTHIGSCLTTVGEIDKIYKVKAPDEKFILSNGHAFLGLAVVLEKYEGKDAEDLVARHGTHPNRNEADGVYCSTGSLGQGLPIAVGMALADRKKNVWCMISDGECAEGSIWEALRIAAENRIENLRVICVANGLGGYSKIDLEYLEHRLKSFYPVLFIKTDLFKFPDFLQGLNAHYVTMTEEQYKEATK